jgi:hypothetical protein
VGGGRPSGDESKKPLEVVHQWESKNKLFFRELLNSEVKRKREMD